MLGFDYINDLIFDKDEIYILDNKRDLWKYGLFDDNEIKEENEEAFYQVINVSGKKHILIYNETWHKSIEKIIKNAIIEYWINSNLKEHDDIVFVFKKTLEIDEELLYKKIIELFESGNTFDILNSIPDMNKKILTGKNCSTKEFIEFFKEKENFKKFFKIK